MTPYKHFVIDKRTTSSYGEIWKDEFQAMLDEQFLNSPTVTEIKEQDSLGSDKYNDILVRVNRGIGTYSGRNIGDDWKRILFSSIDHPVELGKKYFFDNNYWLVFNIDTYKNIASSCMVKRCNNVLRWIDEDGVFHSEPAIFDSIIARARDQISRDDIVLPQGYINCYVQQNDMTNKIKANQRFIVGNKKNRIGYKVFGNGVRNFLNEMTENDESANLVMLTMGGNYINADTDDLEKGIANAFYSIYSIGNIPSEVSGAPTETFQLVPTFKRDGMEMSSPGYRFETFDNFVCTVDVDGLITFVSEGETVVRTYSSKNDAVYFDMNVVVSSEMLGRFVSVTPLPTYIYENDVEEYSCYLYENGVQTAKPFTFGVSSESKAPSQNYSLIQVDGNTFHVVNHRRSPYSDLIIDCIGDNITKTIAVELRGRW